LRNFEAKSGCHYVSDSSASDWPPLLEEIIINGDLFTNTGVDRLPKTIRKMYIMSGHLVDSGTILQCCGPSLHLYSFGKKLTGLNPKKTR